jgi:hypothetical protein
MDERVRFVARLLEGEKMAGPCREFGISRDTGYKLFERYRDCEFGLPRAIRTDNGVPFAVRQRARPIRAQQARGAVAALGYSDPAHQASSRPVSIDAAYPED